MRASQQSWVLGELLLRRPVTSMRTFKQGITRLSSIIHRLRNEGYKIQTTMKDPKKKGKAPYAEYSLKMVR